MGEIVVLAKLVQCLWRAGNDASGDALLDVGEPIEAFAAHHRVGNYTFFAQPLQRAGAYFQQVGQLLAREPDFRRMQWVGLFFEDVIGDSFDLLAQIPVDFVIECDDLHSCRFVVSAAKMMFRKTMLSIVGNDYGKFLRMTQKTVTEIIIHCHFCYPSSSNVKKFLSLYRFKNRDYEISR